VKDSPFVASVSVSPGDVSTIIYTSGTTGKPKGVELTHSNVIYACRGGRALRAEEPDEYHRSLAFLPWSHVFGQVLELHALVGMGGTLAIVPSREYIMDCMNLAKPTFFATVPLFIHKVSWNSCSSFFWCHFSCFY
jgi:long-chain acyl-CoA synthetase